MFIADPVRRVSWNLVRPEHAFEIMNYDVEVQRLCVFVWINTADDQKRYHFEICIPRRFVKRSSGYLPTPVSQAYSWRATQLTTLLTSWMNFENDSKWRHGLQRHTPQRGMPSCNAITQWSREWSNTWFDLERRSALLCSRWDRPLSFLLWAYREMPNATTKVSPYKLVYERFEFPAVFQMD